MLHTDVKAISKNHSQSSVPVVFASVCAPGKRYCNQPLPGVQLWAQLCWAIWCLTTPLHMKKLHSFDSHLYYDQPKLRGFLIVPPLINSSNSTLGDLRVVSATHAGSKYVVRKENTYTRVIIICLNVHQGRPVYLYFTPRQAYFSLSDAMLSNSCSRK